MNFTGMIGGTVLATVLMVLGTTSPVGATPETNERFRASSSSICVDKEGPLRGWRLHKAMASWNSTGVVNLYYKYKCAEDIANVTVRADKKVTHNGKEAGGIAIQYITHQAPDGAWIHTKADIVLSNSILANIPKGWKKCWGWLTTVHELGHIIGLPHHMDIPNSVMSYSFPVWDKCMQLQPIDHRLVSKLGY